MSTIEQLAARWRDEAELLRKHGAEQAAATSELHAHELVAALRSLEDEALTLTEASEASGYSDRRLREMIADGTLANMGRKGAPRVRRGDLPSKPGRSTVAGYDPEADAANILNGVTR